ncbi:MAG: hypothetical protein EOO80_00605 [Oxalobacteraceae bacterium]|jgi:uncharacterized membrane protein AbrB (regulator of aidB expression)|nr:MAG: hypothetical protein EOO80_00605 [Oxalobacteraceae bacterium]
MARLATHSGAEVQVVAVSQSIRLVMVVFLTKTVGTIGSTNHACRADLV